VHAEIQLAITGAAAGALYALLASGLVVIYRSSGVLNFAQGALATLATYMYLHASQTWGWPLAPSIVLGILLAMLVGGIFQYAIVRPLRYSPPIAKVVATLGLMIAITAGIQPVFGYDALTSIVIIKPTILTLPFGSPKYVLPSDRFWLLVITVLVMLGLWAVYRFTGFGRKTRAAADNERATSLLGISPQRLELTNWLLGSALAGVAGILISTLSHPSPSGYTASLIAAIAVALVGSFRSFSVMLVLGILLGSAQSVLLIHTADLQSFTGLGGWSQALPLLVILVAVIVGGRSIALKGSFDQRQLPKARVARSPLRNAAVALVVGLAWFLLAPLSVINSSSTTLISAVACMSVIVVTGFAGQISLAQMTFVALGGFATARLSTDLGVPFPIPIVLGALAVVPIGVLVGMAAVRVRGLNLAVVTLGFALVMDVMFFTNVDLTGADAGLKVKPASIGSLDLNGLTHIRGYGIVVLVVTIMCGVGVAYLRKSPIGVELLALRANERGAAASGMSVRRTKLLAFGVGAFIAGIAGSLQGYRSITLGWEQYAFTASIVLVAYAYLGGVTRVSGAVIAGVLMTGGLLSHFLDFGGHTEDVIQVLGGLGLMQIVVLHPDGLAAIPRQIRGHLEQRRARQTYQSPGRDPQVPVVRPGVDVVGASSTNGGTKTSVATLQPKLEQ